MKKTVILRNKNYFFAIIYKGFLCSLTTLFLCWVSFTMAASETDSKRSIERQIVNLMQNMENLMSQAENGNANSQYELGLIYIYKMETENNGFTDNYNLSIKWLREAAEKHNLARAKYVLAFLLSRSSGDDLDLIMRLFTESASDDYVPALHRMGLLKHYGGLDSIRINKSNEEAAEFFRRATSRGSLRSQARLAHFYFEGLGVTRDTTKAYILYLDAAQRGLYRAYSRLALDWHDRGGLSPDSEKFEEYWWKYKNNEDREPFCGEDEEGRDYFCGSNRKEPTLLYEMFLHFEDYILQ